MPIKYEQTLPARPVSSGITFITPVIPAAVFNHVEITGDLLIKGTMVTTNTKIIETIVCKDVDKKSC